MQFGSDLAPSFRNIPLQIQRLVLYKQYGETPRGHVHRVGNASTGTSAATVDKSTLSRTALRRASSQLGKEANSADGHTSQASPLVNR